MEKEILEGGLNMNRKRFLSRLSLGIGSVALGSLMIPDLFSGSADEKALMAGLPHFAPKAKRIIYLFRMAPHRNWICLIINQNCRKCLVKICRIQSAKASA